MREPPCGISLSRCRVSGSGRPPRFGPRGYPGALAVLALALSWAAGTLSATAAAQPAGEPSETATTATLPASNEAMLLCGRIEQTIRQGNFRLAIALIERLTDRSTELVIAPPGRTYYPVWRQAGRLLDRLPPAGLELYRQLHDAEVAARLREATASGDVDALVWLFRAYRGSSVWPAVGRELVAHLLDAGRFGQAVEATQLLAAAGEPDNLERRAQLAVALGQLGQWLRAGRMISALRADPSARQRPEWGARIEALERWLERSSGDAYPSSQRAARLRPALRAGTRWRRQLDPRQPGFFDDDGALADAVGFYRRLPQHSPLIDGDTLVVRLRGTLWAYDTLTLAPRWQLSDLVESGPTGAWPVREPDAIGTSADGYDGLSADGELLLGNTLRHSVSSGFGLVFTIEGPAALDVEAAGAGSGRFGEIGLPPVANTLAARDLLTGRLVWRHGGDVADPLYGVAFQDCPVIVGENLCVPVQRGRELHLCLLDPATGRLLRAVPVVGPPTYFTPAGGRCLLATDETSIYVCTGNGVVASFSRRDLSWMWATTYPSTLAQRRSTGWWPPQEQPHEFGVDRPIITGELCVLAPLDCPYIFALERASGRQRWRIERGAYEFLVGAGVDGIVVGGGQIACLDPRDGHTLRWRSVPLEPTGRPTMRGESIFVPTRRGVVALDGETGKVVLDERGPRPLPIANLVSTPTALFAVSPNAVVKYPDIDATRRRCSTLLAADSGDARARLAQAWVDVLAGDYGRALETLDTLAPDDPALAAGREHLLTELFVVLSAESAGGAERLTWLRGAAALTTSSEMSARLAALIGQALEEDGRWAEAVRHYGDSLAAGPTDRSVPTALMTDAADPDRQVAPWLHAVACLRVGLSRLEPDQVAAAFESWLPAASAEFLQRLHLAVPATNYRQDAGAALVEWRGEVERALTLMPLPPELLIEYLPAHDDPGEEAESRRVLHLARWETHVALGMLAAGRADREYWHEHLAGGGAGLGTQPTTRVVGPRSGDEAQRVRRIETALGKLEDAASLATGGLRGSITGRYQWKLWEAELIVDSRQPATAMRDWIPVRMLADNQLTLRSAVLGRAWRQTVDALEHGSGAQAALRDAAHEITLGHEYGEGDQFRQTWPAAISGHLAVIPVRGGLVCVGLGPERGGGRRLWEYPVPEWAGIPTRFAETAAAGPLGVYVVRRNDRVALIGWSDGQVWWQRGFPGMRVRRILPVGERLIVLGQDGQVVSVDATFGDRLCTLPSSVGTAQAVAAVGATVLIWTEQAVGGFTADTFECRWAQPCRGVAGWAAMSEAGWIAYRERQQDDWMLVDAGTGEPVIAGGLGDLGEITAMTLEHGDLLVAGFARITVEGDEVPVVRLAAFDLAGGQRRWRRELVTLARVNVTQLRASPEWIPLLVARSDYEYVDGGGYRLLALHMLDKHTGELGAPVSIFNDFCDSDGVCGAYLLATPDRIIVQANGILAAYGSSTLRSRP